MLNQSDAVVFTCIFFISSGPQLGRALMVSDRDNNIMQTNDCEFIASCYNNIVILNCNV